jgi:hypothetical protein
MIGCSVALQSGSILLREPLAEGFEARGSLRRAVRPSKRRLKLMAAT